MLRATRAFVKRVFVVLIVEATKELVKRAPVVVLRATRAFVKIVFVVLIVEATKELVNKAGKTPVRTDDIFENAIPFTLEINCCCVLITVPKTVPRTSNVAIGLTVAIPTKLL